MLLADMAQKDFGDLAQCSGDFKEAYDQISDHYKRTDEQHVSFPHNLACKDAHCFYVDCVRLVASFYDEDRVLLEK